MDDVAFGAWGFEHTRRVSVRSGCTSAYSLRTFALVEGLGAECVHNRGEHRVLCFLGVRKVRPVLQQVRVRPVLDVLVQAVLPSHLQSVLCPIAMQVLRRPTFQHTVHASVRRLLAKRLRASVASRFGRI